MTDFTTALEKARGYAAHSYAPNTRLAYANDWKLFTAWCIDQQRRPLPATPETILAYMVTLANQVRVTTIDRRLCGIAFYHRQAGKVDPTTDPEVLVTLRGLRRAKGIASAAKAALTIGQVRQIVDHLPADLRCKLQSRNRHISSLKIGTPGSRFGVPRSVGYHHWQTVALTQKGDHQDADLHGSRHHSLPPPKGLEQDRDRGLYRPSPRYHRAGAA